MKWGVRKSDKTSGKKLSPADEEKQIIKQVEAYLKTPQGKANAAGLPPEAIPIVAYGAVIAGIILVQMGKMRADSGRKDAKKSGDAEFNKDPKLKQKMSVSQLNTNVVKHINPNYGEPGTKMNCRRCTMAYEMRRRGYDVKATESKYASGQTIKGLRTANNIEKSKKYESIWGEKLLGDQTTFATATPIRKADAVFAGLSKNPNGSRGELGVGWLMGGGHSMAWEVVNNKPVIFDTQNSKTYTSPKEFSEFTPTMYVAAQTRLDNTSINDEFIRRWVTNV
jgi:hypothetical protein